MRKSQEKDKKSLSADSAFHTVKIIDLIITVLTIPF